MQVLKVERLENDILWKMYASRKHFIKMSAKVSRDFWTANPKGSDWAVVNSTAYDPCVSPSLATNVESLTSSLWSDHELDKEVNELYLFHGTKYNYVDAIKTTGFDERVSSTGGLFGTGIYFAENSSKSDEYVVPVPNQVYCYIFVCRVCIGIPFLTGKPHNELRRPPCLLEDLTPCAHPRFDSIIGMKATDSQKSFLQKYREFIIYDRQQCYPEFLITYRRETKEEWEVRMKRQREEDQKEERRKAEAAEQRRKWEEEERLKLEAEEKRRVEEEKRRKEEEDRAVRVREEMKRLVAERARDKSPASNSLNLFAPTFKPSSNVAPFILDSSMPEISKLSLDLPPPRVPLFVPNSSLPASGFSTIPQCKFGSICSRPDCMLAHPERKGLSECRYGRNCTRPNCRFIHPSG